jgi:hypothetical protein
MYSDEDLIKIHDTVREGKEHLVVEHGQYNMPPVLALHWQGHTHSAVIDLLQSTTGLTEALQRRGAPQSVVDNAMRPSVVLHAILDMVVNHQRRPPAVGGGKIRLPPPDVPLEEIWLSLEQFQYGAENDREKALAMAGTLQEDFETNPDSKVLEALATYVAMTDSAGIGEWARLTSAHRRIEGGGMEWLPTEIRRSDREPLDKAEEVDALLDVMLPYLTRESLA